MSKRVEAVPVAVEGVEPSMAKATEQMVVPVRIGGLLRSSWADGGVETPHVVEFERHVNPTTGEAFVRPRSTVRPATSEELMGLD